MIRNVCSVTERFIRVVVGLAVLSLALVVEGPARYWALLGLIPIATAIYQYCPISQLLKHDSCKRTLHFR